MPTRFASALLAAALLAACDPKNVVGLDASNPPGPDAAQVPPDAADPPQPPDAAFRCVAPDTGALTTLASLCDDLVAGEARIVHANAMKCPGEPLQVADMPHLVSSFIERCEPGTRRESDLRRLEARIATGRVAYDPAKQAACKALRPGDDAGLPILDGGAVVEPCRSILVGKVAQGASCEFSEECAPGLYCSFGTAGTCSGVCTPLVAEGRPCEPALIGCAEGTWCYASHDGGIATCQRMPALGQACSGLCASGQCEGGVCVAVPPAKEGEPCISGECGEGLGCAGWGDGGIGSCRPLAKEGEACNGSHPPCADCLSCSDPNGGACLKDPAVGDPCTDNPDDPWKSLDRLWCQSGTWALKPRTGEKCTAASGCLYMDDFCRFASAGAADGLCTRQPSTCEPCGNRFDLSSTCQMASSCYLTDPDAGTGVCAPPAVEGEGCDWGARRCAEGLVCNGACVRPAAAVGASCHETGCGEGLYCPANDAGAPVCVARKIGGAPCAGDWECLSDYCNEGACTANPCPDKQISSGCWMGSAFEYFGYLVFFAAVLRRRRTE